MTASTKIRDELNAAALEYLASAAHIRSLVLQQVPKQLELVQMCLNKLANIVIKGGIVEPSGFVRSLSPEELSKIVKTVDQAYKMQSHLIAIPTSFETASMHINIDEAPQNPNIGTSKLPEPLTPIDAPATTE